jgi:hypothetical protein
MVTYSLKYRMMSMAFAFSVLSGCGTVVPEIQELPGSPDDGQLLVKEIVRRVHCEVQDAVQYVILTDEQLATQGLNGGKRLTEWLDTWGAQVQLNLTIVESTSLNPGVTLNTPMIPANTIFPGNIVVSAAQNYNFGIGASLSSEATRTDQVGAYYTVPELMKNKLNCAAGDPFQGSLLLQSDLKLKEWLATLALTRNVGDAGNPSDKNVISHEVKFEIISNGDITPTWTLVRVSANTGGNFFNTKRKRTHDLTITLGPNEKPPPAKGAKKSVAANQLSSAAASTFLASQIGLAVSNSVRNLLP